jgi:glycerol-3-phosphate acyltransferase PlsY
MVNLGLLILGYLSGSLSFSVWITRLVKGVDVREGGSRHAGATNTIRQAGWVAGVVVLGLDILKGFLPVWLANRYGTSPWVVPLTAALVVAGHCWPLFVGFRGGMGLAPAGGTLIAINPLGFVIGLGVLVALVLLIRHAARASLIAVLLIGPVLLLFGLGWEVFWLSMAQGMVLAWRFRIDWHREYRELWLDRPEGEMIE